MSLTKETGLAHNERVRIDLFLPPALVSNIIQVFPSCLNPKKVSLNVLSHEMSRCSYFYSNNLPQTLSEDGKCGSRPFWF